MELGLQKKQKIEEDDRIYQLPEEILHRILYLLPIKSACRTSILSKSWQHAWSSFSYNLDFDDEVEHIKGDHVEDSNSFKEKRSEIQRKLTLFINFIDKSLQTLPRNKSIEKFRLRLTFTDWLTQLYSLNKLVTFATDRNVKELTLDVWRLYSEYDGDNRNRVIVSHRPCLMPHVMCDSKTITVLKLSGFYWLTYAGVKFSQLRILSLSQVFVHDHDIQHLILNCPLMECIELINCKDLRYLKLSNLLRLDCVHVLCCEGLEKTEIESPSLQTFRYEPFCNLHHFNLVATEEVIIDAPNLVSLECIMNKSSYCSFKSIPNLKEVELECRSGSDFTSWSNNLNEIVGKFTNPAGLNLVIRFDEGNDIVLERLSEIMLCSLLNLKELRPEIILSSTNSLSLVKRLLHGRQLKTLSIVSSSSNLVEILNEKILNREVDSTCCKDSSTECWRNSLDDAKIEDLDTAEDFGNSNWISLLKSYQTMQYQTTTFRFKWIPH